MKYNSSTEKNELMPFAATWMNLEIVTLRDDRRRNTIQIPLYMESK